MKAETASIENKVDQLLVCLVRDVQHLEKSLLDLNEMRRLVIKRDEVALSKLLRISRPMRALTDSTN